MKRSNPSSNAAERAVQAFQILIAGVRVDGTYIAPLTDRTSPVRPRPRLGGLLNSYERAA